MNKDYMRELDEMFRRMSVILHCNDWCEEKCVFEDVGTGAGCPLNEFRDRIDDVMGTEV